MFKVAIILASLCLLSACSSDPVASDFRSLYDHPSSVDQSFTRLRADHVSSSWQMELAKVRDLPRLQKLAEVNRYFNAFQVSWLTWDAWHSPHDLETQGGLCRDYALAKYEMLAELGFAEQDMRIPVVIVDGEKMWRGYHAVLTVRVDGHIHILDSTYVQDIQVDAWPLKTMRLLGQAINDNGTVSTSSIATTRS